MCADRSSSWDRVVMALALLPPILSFVLPTVIYGTGTSTKFERLVLSYTGMAIGVLLGVVILVVARRTTAGRLRRLQISAVVAMLPAGLLAMAIGMQWVIVVVLEFFVG